VPALVRVGRWLGLALAALLTAPLAVVVAAAFAPSPSLGISSEQWVAGAGAGRAFRYVLETWGGHLATSAAIALGAGALALGLGVPAGVALGLGQRRRASSAIEAFLTLPLAVPGLAVAIALLSAFGRLHLDLTLLVVGHVLYTLPYATRAVGEAARVHGLGPLCEAARTLGADRAACVRRVLWPSLRRAVASAALMALAVSFGEFNVSFLLASPAHGTFPAALYLTYTTNSFPVAAAATVLFLAGLVPLVALALRLGQRPQQGA
jgi:putative spermidine/putrescine transport system permease protein